MSLPINIYAKTFFSLIVCFSLLVLPTNPGPVRVAADARQPKAIADALPLNFELNQGQTHQRVKFLARSDGYVLFLTATEAVMALDNSAAHRKGKDDRDFKSSDRKVKPPRSIVRMKLKGANPTPEIEGLDPLPNTSNYFAGSDPTAWRTDIPNYARVRYGQVYPGIDMVYYGNQRRLEYDFIVAPGANPEIIEIAFGGINDFEISRMGELLLHTQQGDLRQSKPVAYQEVNGVKEEVSVSYIPRGAGRVGFQLGA